MLKTPCKCNYEPCDVIIDSGRSDKKYCCQEHQDADHYRRKAETEKRLNQIKGQIRRCDKILKRLYFIFGSRPISIDHLQKEGFEDGGYSRRTLYISTKEEVQLFLNYGFKRNPDNLTITVIKSDDIRIN